MKTLIFDTEIVGEDFHTMDATTQEALMEWMTHWRKGPGTLAADVRV